MKHYLEPVDTVYRETESSADGLSQEQVRRRPARDGKNKLAEPKKESLVKRFFSQMMDPMILILLASALVWDDGRLMPTNPLRMCSSSCSSSW
ncbi:MAG: cation-transporting P-type ATPase [Christensenellaceae bacterium]